MNASCRRSTSRSRWRWRPALISSRRSRARGQHGGLRRSGCGRQGGAGIGSGQPTSRAARRTRRWPPPFAGCKHSGWGYETGKAGLKTYLQTKIVWAQMWDCLGRWWAGHHVLHIDHFPIEGCSLFGRNYLVTFDHSGRPNSSGGSEFESVLPESSCNFATSYGVYERDAAPRPLSALSRPSRPTGQKRLNCVSTYRQPRSVATLLTFVVPSQRGEPGFR